MLPSECPEATTQSSIKVSIHNQADVQLSEVEVPDLSQNFMVLSEEPVTNNGSMKDGPIKNFHELIIFVCPVKVLNKTHCCLFTRQILMDKSQEHPAR